MTRRRRRRRRRRGGNCDDISCSVFYILLRQPLILGGRVCRKYCHLNSLLGTWHHSPEVASPLRYQQHVETGSFLDDIFHTVKK